MTLAILPTLKVFWQHVRRHKLAASTILFAIVCKNLIDIGVPLLNKWFFDTLTSQIPSPELLERSLTIVWVLLAVWLLRWLFYRIAMFMSVRLMPRIMAEMQVSAFAYLLDHSYKFYANAFAGALVRKVNRLARAFDDIADQVLWSVTNIVMTLVGVLVIFYLRSPFIATILAGWVLVFIVINVAIAMWKLKFDTERAAVDSEATGALSDAVSNAITIKQFAAKAHEVSIYDGVMDRWRHAHKRSWEIGSINEAIQALLMIFLEAALLYFAVRFYVDGRLTLGDLALIQFSLFGLFEKLWDFGRVIRQLYEAFADAKEMVDILNTSHDVQDVTRAKKLVVKKGEIVFDDVSFAYNKARPVLDHMELTIDGHEKVAFVGPSGAGKSTITKLLLRFFDVSGGKITVDGQNIAKVTQESLRSSVALVPQDPILFHRTLMENIRYGRRDATDEEVIEAAKKAHCHEFISQLTSGYDTLVGERGVKLSGGERQRVAIARAILKNAPILVLDEATSSLDSESEALIQDALKELMKDKTVIVIAHRLSTIMQMDRIVVVEKGKVSDAGTHAELLAKQGTYSRLWSIQAGGFLP